MCYTLGYAEAINVIDGKSVDMFDENVMTKSNLRKLSTICSHFKVKELYL